MGIHQYNLEAEHCRKLAAEFVTRPERRLLYRIAETFEDLAGGPSAGSESKELFSPVRSVRR